MKLNTLVRVDGRIGTICYHQLNGTGGVWGVRRFNEADDLPVPEFLLREKSYEPQCRTHEGFESIECVGTDYEQVSRYELMTEAELATALNKAERDVSNAQNEVDEILEARRKHASAKFADGVIEVIASLGGVPAAK